MVAENSGRHPGAEGAAAPSARSRFGGTERGARLKETIFARRSGRWTCKETLAEELQVCCGRAHAR